MVLHVDLHAALLVGQRHHRAHIVLRHVQVHGHDGLAHLLDTAGIGHLGRVLDLDDLAIALDHFVDHAGRGGDQVLVEFALQALLHDFHVQQAQEAAAKAEAQRLRDFRLELQGRIVELQLFQRIAQLVIFAGFGGVQTREHLGLDFLEAGQGLGGRAQIVGKLLFQRDGVAHLGCLEFLDAGDDVTHLAGAQRVARHVGRSEHAQVVGFVGSARSHHLEALATLEFTIDHAHQHHDAHVSVEPAVDDHGAQLAIGIALGRRHLGNHGLQDLVDAHAGLGRAGNGIAGIDADDVLDLGLGVVGVGLRQIHLVENGRHLHAEIQRGIAVGHGLCLYALRGVHHQQRSLAGRQGTRDFVREVHVAGRVDEVEVVDLTILGLVLQGSRLRLDGDAALFLDIHRVQHLGFHVTVSQASATLDQAVGQRRLAMVDVRNDGKISDVVHQREGLLVKVENDRVGAQEKRARP